MTINEIAELAQVSRATVSRYLNDGYVSKEKKEKIRKVIEETGYTPSKQAKMLRTNKTGLIGVIIPKINSDSVSRMVAGISEVLNEKGYQLILANTNNNEKEELKFLRTFSNNNVDGIILCGTIVSREHRELFDKINAPLVILGQETKGRSCVYHDDFAGASDITRLLTKSCDKIAYLGVTKKDQAVGKRRYNGFINAMRERKKEPVIEKIVGFQMRDGYYGMKDIVETIPQIDGVFCATDTIAAGAFKYIREKKLDVPGDIKIVGMGDSNISTIIEPSLSTVHFHYKTSGSEAAKLLMEMIDKDCNYKKEIKMGCQVIERGSTRII